MCVHEPAPVGTARTDDQPMVVREQLTVPVVTDLLQDAR